MDTKDMQEFLQSQKFRGVIVVVVIAVVLLLVFQAGMFVGYRKAAFSYRFGDNYYRVFEGRDARPFRMMMGPGFMGGFMDGHGAAGKIVSADPPVFVVSDTNDGEKVVVVSDDTRIRRFNQTVAPADLKVGDTVVVFGAPNDNSQIEARLIRLIPTASSTKAAKP